MSILSFPNTRNLLNNKKKKRSHIKSLRPIEEGERFSLMPIKQTPTYTEKKKGVARSRQ